MKKKTGYAFEPDPYALHDSAIKVIPDEEEEEEEEAPPKDEQRNERVDRFRRDSDATIYIHQKS